MEYGNPKPLISIFGLILWLIFINVHLNNAMAEVSTPPKDCSQVRVTDVKNVQPYSDKENKIRLGSSLIITVENLQCLLEEEVNKKKKIILFFNGMPMKGIYRESIDKIKNELHFNLKYEDDTKDAWKRLIGSPEGYLLPVSVSVGLEDEYAVATEIDNDKKFNLIIINKRRFYGWVIFTLATLILFIMLAKKSAIIRNYGPASPYSLAWTQMAFWFFLIVSAFIFIRMVTDANASITGSILWLMGIASGTTLGARVIDANKLNSQLQKLMADRETIEAQLNKAKVATPPPPNLSDLENNYSNLLKQIAISRSIRTNVKSRGFIDDILSDINGINLHRFQMFIWTIVLGIILCVTVYRDLSMPDFPETLLALIGISSGTYLGFKFPEQHSL